MSIATIPHVRPVTLADVRGALDAGGERDAWLWPGYVYRGQINEVVADPKVGKTLVTLDLAARFSLGIPSSVWFFLPCA